MNQMQRFDATLFLLRKCVGKEVTGVSCGPVDHHLAQARGEVLLNGEQEFVSISFTDGTSIRIESRSGFKGEGGFLVLRNS